MRFRLTLALLVAACSTRTGAGSDAGGAGASGRPTPAAVSPCEAQREQIRSTIATAPGACSSDADCASYPGGPVDCGGVVDKVTAERLWKLTAGFREQQCGLAVRCAPRAVRAVCEEGRCRERPVR